MKSIGTVGAIGLLGLGSSPAQASAAGERVTGTELSRLVRAAARSDDVGNVASAAVREAVTRGKPVEVSQNGNTGTVFTRGSAGAAKANGLAEVAAGDVMVAGARHTLTNGNTMTVVGFITGDDRFIWYREYGSVESGIKTKATSWDIDAGASIEDTRLVRDETSANGKPTLAKSEFSTQSCPGCDPGPSPGGYQEGQEECVSVDLLCASSTCVACAVSCVCCVPACILCLISACPLALISCCTKWEAPDCTYCGAW